MPDAVVRRPVVAAKEIIALRHALGLTQESFAHELGVVVSAVSRWENGHAKPSPLSSKAIEALRDATPRSPQP